MFESWSCNYQQKKMRGKKTAATKKTNTSSAVKENDPEMIKLLEAKLREMTKSKKIANRISDSEPEDDESEGEDGLDEYEGGDGHEGLNKVSSGSNLLL